MIFSIELKDNGYKIEYQRFNESGDNVSLTIKYVRGFNSASCIVVPSYGLTKNQLELG